PVPRPKLTVSLPPLPVSVMLLTLAAPVVPVALLYSLPVAPAGLGVAVTTTPLRLTGLPFASWSCTTGCCANGTPLRAVLDGGVVSTSWVAAAAVTVDENLIGLAGGAAHAASGEPVPDVGSTSGRDGASTPSAPVT